MADTHAYRSGELEQEAELADTRQRWLLSLPAIMIIMLFAAGPLLVMVAGSDKSHLCRVSASSASC
ncbi:MAG: hypothetical protein AAFV92_10670, partial [Pseudomonadota bacterium]